MSGTLAGVFVARWLPVCLGALVFSATALWGGVLFSVSWLSGRARWSADATEMGRLAQSLSQRWATPFLFVALFSGLAWLAVAPAVASSSPWLPAVAAPVAVMLAVHSSVSLRARRVAGGSRRASQGEGGRRVALVVSMALLIGLIGLHLVRP